MSQQTAEGLVERVGWAQVSGSLHQVIDSLSINRLQTERNPINWSLFELWLCDIRYSQADNIA